MSDKYLDSTGLTYFWNKLKAYFQPKLVSGTNIKTINGTSVLGSGDIEITTEDKVFLATKDSTGQDAIQSAINDGCIIVVEDSSVEVVISSSNYSPYTHVLTLYGLYTNNTSATYTINDQDVWSASYDAIAVTSCEMDSGLAALPTTVAANSYRDVSVSFSKTFADIPNVVVGFYSTSTAGAFGRCSCAVYDVSTTGFTIRVFNGDTSARQPSIQWIALSN